MAYRVLTAIAVMVVGLFAVAIPAAAAPSYGPPGASVTVSESTVGVGASVLFSGDGFDPNEGIRVEVEVTGPNGLRSSSLRAAPAVGPPPYSTQTNDIGHFDQWVLLEHAGTATLTAFGLTSGKRLSLTVQVGPVGPSKSTAPTTTVAVGAGSSSAGGSGLAYTGASILGPLAVGAAALFAGLALLFFGTRGAIRRKHPAPTPSG